VIHSAGETADRKQVSETEKLFAVEAIAEMYMLQARAVDTTIARDDKVKELSHGNNASKASPPGHDSEQTVKEKHRPLQTLDANPADAVWPRVIEVDSKHREVVLLAQIFQHDPIAPADRVIIDDRVIEQGNGFSIHLTLLDTKS
jgi:hypothetical protein